MLLESLLAASAIESWSRNRSATWWKVDQLREELVQLQLAEHGYDYALPRPGDPPNFGGFSRFMQIWEGLPLGKQVAVVMKAVAGRFETAREANQVAAYLLVAFNRDAPGDWYEDKLQWALCALRNAAG
ncbi:hypothetical protein NLM31_36740 [Bradyrhizobium sp. CCGUVB4N]|uniref:hypothetical protein n=1 Tax=Bradyrhizobium sp. CCGUVB4N TaxID=2949631 RepID=UPI0020B394F1|nr:hypothetical protein [Bradyrhizobium sp. CCGUVB4N]MCP3385950.1 hypothetical protein [Bradyrhizobium sp. CCGUVB4N]